MEYAYELDILNRDIVKPNWKKIGDPNSHWNKYYTRKDAKNLLADLLNEEFIQLLEQFYNVARVVVFNKPKNFTPEFPHIDGEFSTKNIFALNIIPDEVEKNGHMIWYKLKNKYKEIVYTEPPSQADKGAYLFDWKDVEEDYRLSINKKIVIIRTDVPHCVFTDDNPRYCLSIRFDHKDHSWETIKENFKTLEKIYHNQKTNL